MGGGIVLLKRLLTSVKHCNELMLLCSVTSSEKVDKENRYADFTIMSVPYPGCEFFREWRQNGYMAEGMMFDWEQVLWLTKCYVGAYIGHS